MGRFVTPKVHYIGCTAIDEAGLRQYLEESGNLDFLDSVRAAREQGLSDGEILTSFYAKLCYKSLTLGHNDNVTRIRDIPSNLVAALNAGHSSVFEHVQLNFVVRDCSRVYCYDEDTEVFTSEGWKNIRFVQEGDTLLTLNPLAEAARWSSVMSMHSFVYEGPLYGWANSQMVSPGMTPDHLLWLAWHDLRQARGLSVWDNVKRYGLKVPVSVAFQKRFVIRKDVPWHTGGMDDRVALGGREYPLEDLMAWLGWMATDGSFSQDRPPKCSIAQSKPVNVSKIAALMNRLFDRRWKMYGPYADNGCVQFTIHDEAVADFAREHIGPNKAERSLSPWLFDCGTKYLRIFLDAAIAGDGTVHSTNGHRCIYTPSAHAAGQYQVIGAMLGMPGNVRTDDRVGHTHDVGGVPLTKRDVSYIVDFSRRGGGTLIKPEYQFERHYSGLVYCPKTADGIVFVRKMGHPFWSGNTHEQVRHRVGTAYSQTSGRYCRGDEIDVVFDPILEPVRDHAETLLHYVEDAYKRMVRLMKLDEMTDFEQKKKATSALRRFLPNGQSNEMGMCLAGDTQIWLGGVANNGRWYANKRTIAELFRNWHHGCERVVHRGYSGVRFVRDTGKFRAAGTRDGKCAYLGSFGTRKEAEDVYSEWAASVPVTMVKRFNQCRNLRLRVLNEATHLFEPGTITDIYESGIKELVFLRTESGHTLRCSRDHRVLTRDGWATAGELKTRDQVAISGLRAIHPERAIPKRLREGIGLWTTQQRERLIRPVDRCWVCGAAYHRSVLVLDHVVPVIADLARALDPSNLKPICEECNRIKTAGEQKLARRANAAGSKFVRLAETPSVCSEEMTYDLAVGPHHNFVANGLVVHNSFNLRSVRHMVQVRTARHAEWEIRDIFGQVYQILRPKFPLLFHGAKEEMIDGLVEVSGMKMQPYEKSE